MASTNSIKIKAASHDGRKLLLQTRGPGALAIANTLDEILDESDLEETSRNRYSVILRKLCGACSFLPDSHMILSGLEITSAYPVACGGNADVHKGLYNGHVVAIKTLRVSTRDDLEKLKAPFFKEAVTWKRLRHRNVIPFLGASTTHFSLSLVSAWMENGNINSYVKATPEANRLELLADVAIGVQYLHSVNCVHGDLKGANILISADKRALLADFGLMNILLDSSTDFSSPSGGTVRWMSPELLSPEIFGWDDSRPTKASDVYALAMVVLEVLSGTHPFPECSRKDRVIAKVISGKRPIRPQNATCLGFSEELWCVLEESWKQNPDQRPTVATLQHILQQASPSWVALVAAQDGIGSDTRSNQTPKSSGKSWSSFSPPVERRPSKLGEGSKVLRPLIIPVRPATPKQAGSAITPRSGMGSFSGICRDADARTPTIDRELKKLCRKALEICPVGHPYRSFFDSLPPCSPVRTTGVH